MKLFSARTISNELGGIREQLDCLLKLDPSIYGYDDTYYYFSDFQSTVEYALDHFDLESDGCYAVVEYEFDECEICDLINKNSFGHSVPASKITYFKYCCKDNSSKEIKIDCFV